MLLSWACPYCNRPASVEDFREDSDATPTMPDDRQASDASVLPSVTISAATGSTSHNYSDVGSMRTGGLTCHMRGPLTRVSESEQLATSQVGNLDFARVLLYVAVPEMVKQFVLQEGSRLDAGIMCQPLQMKIRHWMRSTVSIYIHICVYFLPVSILTEAVLDQGVAGHSLQLPSLSHSLRHGVRTAFTQPQPQSWCAQLECTCAGRMVRRRSTPC